MGNSSLIKNLSSGISKKVKSLFDNPYKAVNLSWARLKYYKHLPEDKIRKHILFGNSFYFYNAQQLIHGINEIFLEEIYKQELNEKPFIIDCGANIGLSVIYLKEKHPDAEIIAFEPDEKNFELLKRNIQSFGYSDILLEKEAVWIDNTTIAFSNEGAMHSRIMKDGDSKTIQIKAKRLRDLLTRQIDFLKLDIEGAEYQVIKDCSERLQNVKNIFIEFHGYFDTAFELIEILQILEQNKFSFYIKEAANVYDTPFDRQEKKSLFDIQLNIFSFKRH